MTDIIIGLIIESAVVGMFSLRVRARLQREPLHLRKVLREEGERD